MPRVVVRGTKIVRGAGASFLCLWRIFVGIVCIRFGWIRRSVLRGFVLRTSGVYGSGASEMVCGAVRFRWCVLPAAAAAVVVAGCGSTVSGLGVAGPERFECGRVDAPLWTVPLMVRGMPRVAVPLPSGWSRQAGRWAAEPVDPPRGAGLVVSNPSLKEADRAPSMLVNIDSFPPDAIDPGDAEQRVLDETVADIEHSSRIVAQSFTLVCGHPSVDVQYVNRGREAHARVVATRAVDGWVWRVWVNFLSDHPRNARWVHDTQTMLDGLVVNEMPVQ